MKKIINISIILLSCTINQLYAQKVFTNLDSLISFATTKSITLKSNDIKMSQASKAKLAAVFNIIDPSGNFSTSFTNNTQLPVSLFPAETFGGAPGTFREVQTGIQYNSAYTMTQEIKLLNLQGWESFKLAKINIDLTSSNNKITLKNMHENIANNYYNIVSLQQQLINAQNNLTIADTLYQIVLNKYAQGLVKQQDVNDSKASKYTSEENINQINYLIKQYYLSIKLLCDIPENEDISIVDNLQKITNKEKVSVDVNLLNVNNSLLKEKYALSSYYQAKKALLPTVSFNFNQSAQNYNTSFKPYSGTWFPSQSFGLKLAIPVPNASTIANKYNSKYNYQLAQKTTEQDKIKASLQQQQLMNDYNKAFSQYLSNKELYALRKDSYDKNKNLYAEGLISLDQTLNSYTAMVNANYNLTSAQVSILLAQSKININNTIK
ncbi:MAG: TolC family protein [Chitinophagaceae bacterium]|jgi:outer membrane protein TolC|nr:TolC family protein [Chitinophagaceae bacterium]